MKLALDKRMNDSRYYQLMKLALDKKWMILDTNN